MDLNMIVTCPQCSKRYMLDEALLPREGRQVRCITCQHIWRQAKEESTIQPHHSLLGLNREAPITYSVSRKSSSRKMWILSIAFLLCSIGFLVMGRNMIVPFAPSLERYYEILGLPVTILGSGLSISNATSQIRQETITVTGDLVNTSDRVRYIPPLKIMVVGEKSSPNCLENVKDKGCILDHWDHRLSETSLLPGEHIHFETGPRPKLEGTNSISIEF
jgi:predicted Zn finger-like uncharacterized protein